MMERPDPVSGRVEDVSTQDPEREAKDEVKIVTSDPLDILGVEILAELPLSRDATVDLLHPRKDGRHVARAVTRKPPVRKQPREDCPQTVERHDLPQPIPKRATGGGTRIHDEQGEFDPVDLEQLVD